MGRAERENERVALDDDAVVRLLPVLAEAARATQTTVDRFVSPRIGVVEEARSRRHHFVFGRRGVGKSTLLRKVEVDQRSLGHPVIFIDLETLRGIEYPDVLIRLMAELLEVLGGLLDSKRRESRLVRKVSFRRVARSVRSLRAQLMSLLAEPASAEHTVQQIHRRAAKRGAGIRAAGGIAARPARVGIDLQAERQGSVETSRELESRFTQTKMDGLFSLVPEIRRVLRDTLDLLPEKYGLLLLDDFYHISTEDQPKVLSYVHQLVKNLDIFLKVGGVRHRVNAFVEGDPPLGLQPGQDAGSLSLDLTLETFPAAQTFLEDVLFGICSPVDVSIEELLTDGGRERVVLASGGVARDYLNLIASALRIANERPAGPYRPHNRITAEDVNEASAQLQAQKQEDLRRDSGPEADALRERLADVVRFCLDHNGTNVFIVDGAKLSETNWGKEIQALSELRLLHQIGNVSVQSSEFRGRRFVAFTLDLSHYTGTRSEQIRQIEFWTTQGRQDIRRAGLIYDPGDLAGPVAQSAATRRAPVDWTQEPLPWSDN